MKCKRARTHFTISLSHLTSLSHFTEHVVALFPISNEISIKRLFSHLDMSVKKSCRHRLLCLSMRQIIISFRKNFMAKISCTSKVAGSAALAAIHMYILERRLDCDVFVFSFFLPCPNSRQPHLINCNVVIMHFKLKWNGPKEKEPPFNHSIKPN